ncbi:MAG: ADP-glyceromanno-heptose 6-epimerase [Fibrobacterales bacterium]
MIIVTGGAGFIGSNLVRGLNKKGYTDILIVDNLAKPEKHLNLNRLEFTDYIDKYEFIEKLDTFTDVEAIFHQGACSKTTETDGIYMMDINYEYSKTLYAFCQKQGARFIYASSASVYGNGDNGFTELRENEYPLNIYAYSKFLFDQWIRKQEWKSEHQVAGLRYFNVYGPQENHKESMASVIYHFHNQIKENGTLKIFEGSEDFIRDFIYVNDVVDVNLFLLENPGVSGIFNVGTGKAESFMSIAKIMSEENNNAPIETIPFPDHLKGKYQKYTQADLTNLRQAGYEADFISLDDGVRDYARILTQQNGFI